MITVTGSTYWWTGAAPIGDTISELSTGVLMANESGATYEL